MSDPGDAYTQTVALDLQSAVAVIQPANVVRFAGLSDPSGGVIVPEGFREEVEGDPEVMCVACGSRFTFQGVDPENPL